MKFHGHFKNFLVDEVNLNQSRLDKLDDRVGAIEGFIQGDAFFKSNFRDLVPQGSYAHRTIIKPAKGNRGFDADVLLEMDKVDGWAPRDYVENLYTSFRSSATYRDMVGRKTRCVMVDYADDFHIDVVPIINWNGTPCITNRHENVYEQANPEGFNAWFKAKNGITGGKLVKVMRLLKYIRDFKQTFTVRSFVLNALVGNQIGSVDESLVPGCYTDTPTALITIVSKLDDYLQKNTAMPQICDPSNLGDDLSMRWNQDQYSNFRDKIHSYAAKIKTAYEDTDKDASLNKWREVLGDEFGKPKQVLAMAKASFIRPHEAPASEQFLEELGIETRINPDYELEIDGLVRKKDGFRSHSLRANDFKVGKLRTLDFSIVRCNITAPFEVKWKVRNRGDEAASEQKLRGEISSDEGRRTKTEPTRYKGSHYVECYVIISGVCVAMRRIAVNIVDR